MNRNHLALFDAVARAGGITRAAELERISQPAISKQIAELEDALNVKLLERLPRGCELTEAGKILADYARRWRSLEEAAGRAIEEYRGLKQGRLALGASKTIGGYLLPRVIAEFHKRHPGIELQVEIANTQKIQESLANGSIEIGFTEGVEPSQDLQSQVFFEDELVAIAPPDHPLLAKKGVSIREVCKEPLILREEGSGTRAVLERALGRKRIKVEPLVAFSSPEAIKNAVAAGMGLAIVSRLIVSLEVQSGTLGIIPIKDLTLRRPLYLQKLPGRSPSVSGGEFLGLLAKKLGAKRANR